MKPLPLALMGAVIGVSVAVQSGVNAHLRRSLGSPLQAALVSFLVGTMVLAALVAVDRTPLPRALPAAPWWIWVGGLLGAFNVAGAILLAPRLGALVLAMVVIAGQLLASMALDHFGLLGYPRAALDGRRVLGALLLVAGAFLAARR